MRGSRVRVTQAAPVFGDSLRLSSRSSTHREIVSEPAESHRTSDFRQRNFPGVKQRHFSPGNKISLYPTSTVPVESQADFSSARRHLDVKTKQSDTFS